LSKLVDDVTQLHEEAVHLREAFDVTSSYLLIRELKSKITAVIRGT